MRVVEKLELVNKKTFLELFDGSFPLSSDQNRSHMESIFRNCTVYEKEKPASRYTYQILLPPEINPMQTTRTRTGYCKGQSILALRSSDI